MRRRCSAGRRTRAQARPRDRRGGRRRHPAGRLKVWITRAEPGAGRTAERVRALGHEPLVASLIRLAPLEPDLSILDGAGALAVTSAAAVSMLASVDRALPVYAVGDATAAAARAAAFTRVRSAGGDVHDLAALLVEERPPGFVAHAGAQEPAADLVGLLRAGGLEALLLPLYTAIDADRLPPMNEGADAVLLHSPRAAAVLARLAPEGLKALPACCLSEAVAEPLRRAGFNDVRAAARPVEHDLLALLGARPAVD